MESQISYKNGKVVSDVDALIERLEVALSILPCEFSPNPEYRNGINQFVDENGNAFLEYSIKMNIVGLIKNKFPNVKINNLAITTEGETIKVLLEIFIVSHNVEKSINLVFEGV